MNRMFFVSECESTNDSVKDYVDPVNTGITALCTFHQTKGKGQYGNKWQEVKNQNIAITLALPVKLITLADSLFNYYTAVLLRDFVANLTKCGVKTKWPNDLIINDRKISGILIEKKKIHGEPYLITGIGINVTGENFADIPNAGSIYTETGVKYDLKILAEQLFAFFERNLANLPSKEEILQNYNSNLYRKDQISCFQLNNQRQNGIIKSADENGFLWIDLEHDGLSKFFHKEIAMLY